ncbi:hypothetical protein N825_33150 [Skermanella stibiiresistens SB22]|uniref:Uncharacterized protein n=1 Tax=Skermanella stibiiresistens SB22 TaxID=1385369 RepID=W9HA96_9PROT|nr:hypothetical protein [Skermanella stibiiresistens]EWY40778.1 hypothetical protein N825_33150 [Skermanella stibiiresistens SB22]
MSSPIRRRALVAAFACAASCAFASGPAHADDGAGLPPFGKLIDRFIELVLPPSPTEALDSVSPEAGTFWSLIADCGYRIAEVETEAGIPPRVKVHLERVLELSEEDQTWIGQRLDEWAAADDSLTATLSRRVVTALLEASEDPRFEAVGVDIALSPIPSATFRLAPRPERLEKKDPPASAPPGPRLAYGR